MAALDPTPTDITTLNIISSHKISAKTTRCLSILTSEGESRKIVALSAKSSVASKAITIAEITRRELQKNGNDWYQYIQLESIVEEKKEKPGKQRKETATEEKVEDVEDEEEEDPFQPVEDKKVRATPVMTIYISREALPTYAKKFG
jgi:hypothetical protein